MKKRSLVTLSAITILLMMSGLITVFTSSSETRTHSMHDLIITLVVIFILGILLITAYSCHRKISLLEKIITNTRDDLTKSQHTVEKLRRQKKFLESQLTTLENWQHDATKVYPDIHEQIEEMHAKAKAAAFNQNCKTARLRKPTTMSFSFLNSLVIQYEEMSDLERSYVTADMTEIIEKRDKAATLCFGGTTEKSE